MGNSPYTTLILIVVMVVAFYFLILRPQRKRQQAQLQTVNAIAPGSRVVTGSGLYGTVVEVGAKQAVLEISPGAHLTVLKQAIVRVVPPGEEDADVPEVSDTTYADITDPSDPDRTDLRTDEGVEDDAYPTQASHDFRTSYQKPADATADATADDPAETPDRPRDTP
jgi:preprotein translocase subunit YajC